MHTYDTIVVGGRLAGAATAMLLARSGQRVLVLERGRRGSDTLSTHAFMRGGVMQLSRWGLLGEIVDAGTPPIRRTVIRYGDDEEIVDIQPRPGSEALYAPRRYLLDRILVDAAERAGAEVRFGVSVTDLLRDADGRVIGVVGRDAAGRRVRAHAPLTIGADGTRSTVARLVDAPTEHQSHHASAMVMGWWSGVEAEGYQWLYAPGAAAGIIPTNDGRVCVWAGTPARSFPAQRRRPALGLHDVLGHVAPDWAARIAAGRRDGPVRGFPGIPGFARRPVGPGWALVGDAGYFKDPLSTHGMTDALRDAELLAAAVIDARDAGAPPGTVLDGYPETRERLSRDLRATVDRVASYDWTMAELRDLLVRMSHAMRPEVEHLSSLGVGAEVGR